MRVERKYVRVYYEVITDERFAGIYDDDRCLSTWLRLLLLADAMWPAPADLPRSAHHKAVALLSGAGLIEVDGHRFRIHGMDAERNARSNAARNAAGSRWGNAKTMLAKPSLAEHSQVPPTPTSGGTGSRADGTNPRSIAARAEEAHKAELDDRRRAFAAIHQRYLRGDLTAAQERQAYDDYAKEPDDLTRAVL